MIFQLLTIWGLARIAEAEERQAAALEALAWRPAPPEMPEAPVHCSPSEPFIAAQAPAARPWREAHVIEGIWHEVAPRRPQLVARPGDRPLLSCRR